MDRDDGRNKGIKKDSEAVGKEVREIGRIPGPDISLTSCKRVTQGHLSV